jgi:hypothetical protein
LLVALVIAGLLSTRLRHQETQAGAFYVGQLHNATVTLFIGPDTQGDGARFYDQAGANEAWLEGAPSQAAQSTWRLENWVRPEVSPLAGWLTLRWNELSQDWDGFWSASSNGPLESLQLRRVADNNVFKASVAMFTGRGMHRQSFEGHRPSFADAPEIGAALAAADHAAADEFVRFGWSSAWYQLRTASGPAHYNQYRQRDLIFYQTNAISLLELTYEYTGGAHGNSFLAGRNWYREGDTWRELALADLFLADADWKTRLGDLVKAGLVRQGASSFVSFEEAKVSDKPLLIAGNEAFTLNDQGVTLHYSPYDVGSFAEGSYAVFVPFDELRCYLRPGGPLKCFRPGLSPK